MCVNEAIILQPEILSRLRGIERYEFQNQFIALFSQENLFSSDSRYNFDFLSWCWNKNELFYHEIVNQELLSAESLRLSCLDISCNSVWSHRLIYAGGHTVSLVTLAWFCSVLRDISSFNFLPLISICITFGWLKRMETTEEFSSLSCHFLLFKFE